jgi:diguanylate cyclase (GGDEF)-like protein
MKDKLREFNEILGLNMENIQLVFRWKSKLPPDEVLYIENLKAELNLQRAILSIVIIALFEIFNFFYIISHNDLFSYLPQYLISVIAMIIICVTFFLIALYLIPKYKQQSNLLKKKIFYNSFWFVLSIAFISFRILDILENNTINNFIILIAILTIIPILESKEAIFLFLFNMVAQIFIVLIFWPQSHLIIEAVWLTLIAIIITQVLFKYYINTALTQKKLMDICETDALTGLLNRYGFDRFINQQRTKCLEKKCYIAAGVLDIDYFKEYNDKLGHLNGDRCLKEIGAYLKSFSFPAESIVSRYGGEEFIIVLMDTQKDQALNIFQQIKMGIENKKIPSACRDVSEFVTISIGFTIAEINAQTSWNDIYSQADKALYWAKRNGRNSIAIYDETELYT